MTEQELRTLVREAISRHAVGRMGAAVAGDRDPRLTPGAGVQATDRLAQSHASHGMFALPAGADTDGPCIIEPSVPCTHCGYCKSYGH